MTAISSIAAGSRTVDINVSGMTCGACVKSVESALQTVAGVIKAQANLSTGRVRLSISGEPDAEEIAGALGAKGYGLETETVVFDVANMHCGSCVGRVEAAARSVSGVASAAANLTTGRLTVTALSAKDLGRKVIKAQGDIGYDAHEASPDMSDHTDSAAQIDAAGRRAALAGALTLPVFVTEMGGHIFPAFHHWLVATFGQTQLWVVQLVLTTIVMVGPGREFYLRGVPALLRRAPEMNALVALGTLAAWAYSLIVVFAPEVLPQSARFVYFEAAAVIVTLILTGRWLEARARGQTGAAIRSLMNLQPQTVRLASGKDARVAQLVPGDVIVARPGEGFAVDGVVTEGQGTVDEAMITGEPEPVAKSPGAPVTSGTINGTGPLTYRATATGADTVLSQIVAMVANAQAARLPVQDLVNKIAGWFVPAVLGIAAVTVALWMVFGPDPAIANALVAGVSVLIIACPCAMGLAIPTSIVVGSGRAAELGVLFREGAALQALGTIRTVAFDKTGTLTTGKPKLVGLATLGLSEEVALGLIAGVEAGSEHPVAHAVLAQADALGVTPATVTQAIALPGQGATAFVEGKPVIVGTPELMQSEGIDVLPLAQDAKVLEAEGYATIFAARSGAVFAVFSVSDLPRAESAETISLLKERGVSAVMLTGDAPAAAAGVARAVGIEDVRARLRPEDKHAAIAELSRTEGPVAFVGDGINDAPALAAADIGIAIGTGTNVAIEAADVVLRSGNLDGVLTAYDVSRHTMRNIRQNLVWAFGYNIALIPVAAGALTLVGGPMLSPMLAAGAMAASSVLVLTNALRLRFIGKGRTG